MRPWTIRVDIFGPRSLLLLWDVLVSSVKSVFILRTKKQVEGLIGQPVMIGRNQAKKFINRYISFCSYVALNYIINALL